MQALCICSDTDVYLVSSGMSEAERRTISEFSISRILTPSLIPVTNALATCTWWRRSRLFCLCVQGEVAGCSVSAGSLCPWLLSVQSVDNGKDQFSCCCCYWNGHRGTSLHFSWCFSLTAVAVTGAGVGAAPPNAYSIIGYSGRRTKWRNEWTDETNENRTVPGYRRWLYQTTGRGSNGTNQWDTGRTMKLDTDRTMNTWDVLQKCRTYSVRQYPQDGGTDEHPGIHRPLV